MTHTRVARQKERTVEGRKGVKKKGSGRGGALCWRQRRGPPACAAEGRGACQCTPGAQRVRIFRAGQRRQSKPDGLGERATQEGWRAVHWAGLLAALAAARAAQPSVSCEGPGEGGSCRHSCSSSSAHNMQLTINEAAAAAATLAA